MAGETEDEIPESGAVFTFGKSKFADNAPSKFWLKNDVPLRISCGDEHTAMVTENGKLFVFGSNNWGQLGLGTKTTVNKPTCVKALKSERVKLAACGRTHTLVYTSRGNLYASGGNNEGQLGLGDCDDRTSFHLVDFFSKHEPVKMLSAGSNTSAALTQDGRLYMWGDNSEGQIGLGKESNSLNPREISVGKRVSWVSCGYYHSAFVTVDGALYTFGEKDSGKLGLSTEKLASHKVPQQVTSISDKVVQVSCGGGHTVALTDHEVYSFGLGQFGQLGHGTFIFESRLPRVVEHFRRGRVKHVECGENHTALITDSGLLYTFGDGRHGKLGLGEENFTNQFKPTLCPRFLDYYVHSVTCGGCHMLVLAKPRPEGSEDLILEEDDITEDYFEKSYTELLGDTHSQSTLNRSLSARVRRRERERSPDQFGQMFRTLPALGGNQLSASLSVPSQIHHSHSKQPGKIPHNSLKIPGKREKSLDDRSSVEDSESVKDLGETADLLNLTHIMKMDPSDKTLTLSPMEKKKVKVVKEHGKEKGKPRDDSALYRKQAELLARKALPTELLRSSSGSSVVGDSLGSGTPEKSPKRHGQDKENLLIALEDRRAEHPQAARSNIRKGMDISKAGSKSFQPKHKQLIKSRDKVPGKDARNNVQMLEKEHSKVEAKSKKVAHKLKGITKPNQEGKTKPKDHPLDVSSQSQKVVGKEKEVKMKPIIVVEQFHEQTMQKNQDPTGEKISKKISPKAQRLKAKINPRTENQSFVPQSKKSDSKKDSKSKKTTQEISTTSLSSCQEDISTKKTKESKAEPNQLLVEDTRKGPTIVSEAAFKSGSVSESEQMKENPLTKVTSFLQDVGMENPARLLGETAISQLLSQSTPQEMPKHSSKQRTLSDVSSLSESFEVSGKEETREAKRTAVTINVKAEPETSDGNLERTSTESKTELHSVVGTNRRSEEEGGEEADEEEERESEGLVNRKVESEEVDDQEEQSESKTLANDDAVHDDTTTKASSEDEEREEEEEKRESEATENVASEAEEEESHGIEDEEEETSEEESGEDEDESKSSEEEESGVEEDEDESKTRKKEESGEDEDESKTSEKEESGEDEDESKTSEEKESGEEEDEDESKTSEKEESGEEEDEDESKTSEKEEKEEDEDESKTSEEEESGEEEDKDESKTSEEEESGEEEDESKTSEEEESGEESEGKIESRSDRSEEESDEEEEDEESEEKDSEHEEESEVEGDSEAEEDEDGEKTSKEEEEDSEEQDSESEDDEDEGESESEAEEEESEEDKEESDEVKEENEESEGDTEDEDEGESGEDEAMSENDEEEEEEESENEEEEEQDSKDKEEEENEEEAAEEESEDREEKEEVEDQEGEEEDNQEEGEEGKEEEEEEEEVKKAKGKLEKASESTKPKSSVKTSKLPSKAKRARAQDDQSDDESHESKQFWDDVLPQYLSLK
ncbi:X-linked retinitis pigmentosa GTPase regulator-like isoform X2 [Carassius carassius]|uniref:X-linked retinitis pigmentosa GTPase regulator-like isoform X2 n=1 Tax=Carassius carassius TaxID=217509 RepID=UPI0028687BCE|nr:X-linked retinitis pigmentosa GTPase regulator-like isoform X2 [Carassius carassius]